MTDKYDDLDDLLDDYDLQSKILAQSPGQNAEPEAKAKAPAPGASSEGQVPDLSSLKLDEELSPEDQQELAKTLADLMQGSGEGGHSGLEALMASITQSDVALAEAEHKEPGSERASEPASGPGSASKAASSRPGSAEKPTDSVNAGQPGKFEDTIAATMDRLNQSQKPGETSEADLMEKLLRDMQKSLGEGGGGQGVGGMDGLISSLLSELSSKEVLYEPLHELHTNYPQWLKDNSEKLEPKELARLKKQQGIVAEVIAKFDDPKYSDDNKEMRAYINDKMFEMQDTGAPPQEIVGDIAGGAFPGFPGAEAPPELPGDCATQ